MPPLRRSADHVVATAFVWRHLVALLAEREGVVGLDDLRAWLARPARRSPRRWPLPRERRLELPDRPGVYRLLRAGGAVLYVGKAASLRQRVSGHFHARGGERALEMLTQARDVSCTETETALEAALLEADEIKRLAPPFNVALAAAGRAVWFATADLRAPAGEPDPEHVVGPLVSPAPVEALAALRAVLALGGAGPARRARAGRRGRARLRARADVLRRRARAVRARARPGRRARAASSGSARGCGRVDAAVAAPGPDARGGAEGRRRPAGPPGMRSG